MPFISRKAVAFKGKPVFYFRQLLLGPPKRFTKLNASHLLAKPSFDCILQVAGDATDAAADSNPVFRLGFVPTQIRALLPAVGFFLHCFASACRDIAKATASVMARSGWWNPLA